jgi:hypothetical protein
VVGGISMNRHSASIALAERQVADAQTAALVEYQAARANLRRRMASPAFIGGVLIGAIALGFLAAGRSSPKRPVNSGRPGVWSRAATTVQVLLPLLLALNSATTAARRAGANAGGTAR